MTQMKISFINCTFALCFVAGAMTVGHPEGLLLRYGFQKDKTYKYKTTMDFFNDAKGGSSPSAKPTAEIVLGISLSATTVSSMHDQRWKFVIDTIGMRMATPAGEDRVLSNEQLKGKSMEVVVDDRGVPKRVEAVDSSALNQTREFGFEVFSRDLLDLMFVFPQYPENGIELNQPWRFSRTDTVSRGGQKIIFSRATECRVVGTATVGNHKCHKIALTVTTRFRGQTASGETTATGTLCFSEPEFPVNSDVNIRAVISAGGTETIQKRSVKTILE
jgi:hypothetical protein